MVPPAGQPLSSLSQQSLNPDIASQVRKRRLSPLHNADPLSKRQHTDGDIARGGGPSNASQTSQSASLAPSSQASPPSLPQRRGWKKNCPICRCDGLDANKFKAHMKEVHLLTDNGRKYEIVLASPGSWAREGVSSES